jgi:ArsR family transcriptional regulator
LKKNEGILDKCKCNVVHLPVVDKVKKELIDEDRSKNLADFFKVFGEPTRIKILNALSLNEMCVCDIAYLLEMQQSAVSHQLRVLRGARLVKYRKEGKSVYYSLDDKHVENIINQGLDHIME